MHLAAIARVRRCDKNNNEADDDGSNEEELPHSKSSAALVSLSLCCLLLRPVKGLRHTCHGQKRRVVNFRKPELLALRDDLTGRRDSSPCSPSPYSLGYEPCLLRESGRRGGQACAQFVVGAPRFYLLPCSSQFSVDAEAAFRPLRQGVSFPPPRIFQSADLTFPASRPTIRRSRR